MEEKADKEKGIIEFEVLNPQHKEFLYIYHHISGIGSIKATYSELKNLFGKPLDYYSIFKDPKVTTLWLIGFFDRKKERHGFFGIIDYKATNFYHKENPSLKEFREQKERYMWFIQGNEMAKLYCNEILFFLNNNFGEIRAKSYSDFIRKSMQKKGSE